MTIIDTNSTDKAYTIQNLTNDQIYRVRVAAINSFGQGPYSNWVQSTPLRFGIDENYYETILSMHFDDYRTGTYDPYGDFVTLLMHMDGDNNSKNIISSSPNSNTLSITANGTSKLSSDQSKFGSNTSLYLDGTANCSLSVGPSDAFNFGFKDFTIELWIYPTSLTGTYKPFIDSRNAANNTSYVFGILISGDVTYLDFLPGIEGRYGTSRARASYNFQVNNWYHVVVTRKLGTLRFFVNGQLLTNVINDGYFPGNMNCQRSSLLIGQTVDPTYFSGYIDDIRITKGIARYSSTFPMLTSPFPSAFYSLIDSSVYNNKVIPIASSGSVSINTDSAKFGGSSASFGGLSFANASGTNIWQLGTTDFTVESWINPTSNIGDRTIAGTYDGANGGWALSIKAPSAGNSPTSGNTVSFTRNSNVEVVDIIIPGVLELARNGQRNSLYNRVEENDSTTGTSPSGTLWNRCNHDSSGGCLSEDSNNWNNICNYNSRTYGDFENYVIQDYNADIIGKELIMKHNPTNRHWLIKFSSWDNIDEDNYGGGFAYTRTELLSCNTTSSVLEFRNGNSSIVQKTINSPIPTGSWSHIAAVRSSGTLRLFLDGVQVGTDTSFTDNITRNNNYGLSIGAKVTSSGNVSDAFVGYLDDLRITKVARYVSNFDKPIAVFADIGPGPKAPSVPLNLTSSENSGVVSLSWSAPIYPMPLDYRAPITSYTVQYSSDSGSSWTDHTVSTEYKALLTRNISGLIQNNSYLFQVKGENSVNAGPYSTTTSIIPPTSAPSGFTVTPDDSRAYMTWIAPYSNSSIRDYDIQYSLDNGSNWETYSHLASSNTGINITGLINGSGYIFKAAAINFAGTGIYSDNTSPVTINPPSDNLYNKTRLLLHFDSN